MKKIYTTIISLIVLTIMILTGKTYAASLDNIDVKTDKTTIRPGEEVTVSISFGESLGAYTFNIAYDNAIFEYGSVNGGNATDTSDKVIVLYYDSTGGTAPRTDMSVTFKAKSELTTSNPTQFLITAEGLANSDASITFDDITMPITKDVLVEPEYVGYSLNLETTGDIIKGEEKAMKLSYSSSMGKYYEHARLVAIAETPTDATVKLLGTDQAGIEHDIIQSGWGDSLGYPIGGKDYAQVLNVRGIFSEIGDYKITLKLIDKDNSDNLIAEKSFNYTVIEKTVTETTPEQTTPETTPSTSENTTKIPTKLPKTGINIYIPIGFVFVLMISLYVYYKKRK